MADKNIVDESIWLAKMDRAIQQDISATRIANDANNLRVDVFSDSSGIDNGLSSGFNRRDTPNFDVIVTVVTSAALFRPSDLSTGLQGFWKLDEGSGTRADSSGNSNTLTDNNTVLSSTDDYWVTSEGSADFESGNTEFLSITDASQTGLDITGDFTMVTWFKAESFPATTNPIMAKTNGSNGYVFYVRNDNQLRVDIEGTTSNSGGSETISVGKWHHIAVTFDDSANLVTFYVNGNVIGVQTNAGTLTNTAFDFNVGFYFFFSNIPCCY